jgi:hypothetical protein
MPPKEDLTGWNSASPTLPLTHPEDINRHTLQSPTSSLMSFEGMPIMLFEEELTGYIDTQEKAITDLSAYSTGPLCTLEPFLPD